MCKHNPREYPPNVSTQREDNRRQSVMYVALKRLIRSAHCMTQVVNYQLLTGALSAAYEFIYLKPRHIKINRIIRELWRVIHFIVFLFLFNFLLSLLSSSPRSPRPSTRHRPLSSTRPRRHLSMSVAEQGDHRGFARRCQLMWLSIQRIPEYSKYGFCILTINPGTEIRT